MILLALITIFYAGLILFLVFGFDKVPEFTGKTFLGGTGFSIVVPYRNEADDLTALLHSLAALDYPADKFELILVNDASEDASEEICRRFKEGHPRLRVLLLAAERRSASPKKDAVNTAIGRAQHDYILTTDADCLVPEKWLRELDAFLEETGANLVACPVHMAAGEGEKAGWIQIFQEIDFMSLQASTVGGFGVDKPFMCNAAALCYEKTAFLAVNGFEGNEDIAGGDDVFLLEKFAAAGYRSAFLKSRQAIVKTHSLSGFGALLSQRIRWAAKTSAYRNYFAKMVAWSVFLMNISLLLALIAVLTGRFSQQAFLLGFLIKFNVDFYLIYKAAVFFQRERVMKNYLWCSFIYPFFSSYVAITSLFVGFSWKGRRFKK